MLSFPPRNWEVRYLQEMDTYMAEPDNHKHSMATLLAVKPGGAHEGNFRLVLAGTEDISVKLPIADFIPHKAMEGFSVVGQFQPGNQIITQPNSTATSWVDFQELVAAQYGDIYDQNGDLERLCLALPGDGWWW
jgi:hypothetical protein